jgi:CheY-like chemotaxis protein
VASNRKMLQMLLKKLDVQSDTAADGQAAVDLVLGDLSKFRLVFMDNLMPLMVGRPARSILTLCVP